VSGLYWRADEQLEHLSPYFPKSHNGMRTGDTGFYGLALRTNAMQSMHNPCSFLLSLWSQPFSSGSHQSFLILILYNIKDIFGAGYYFNDL
jgi:hypothetical protein